WQREYFSAIVRSQEGEWFGSGPGTSSNSTHSWPPRFGSSRATMMCHSERPSQVGGQRRLHYAGQIHRRTIRSRGVDFSFSPQHFAQSDRRAVFRNEPLVSLSHHKTWVFAISGLLIGASLLNVYVLAPRLQRVGAACRADAPDACVAASRFS